MVLEYAEREYVDPKSQVISLSISQLYVPEQIYTPLHSRGQESQYFQHNSGFLARRDQSLNPPSISLEKVTFEDLNVPYNHAAINANYEVEPGLNG